MKVEKTSSKTWIPFFKRKEISFEKIYNELQEKGFKEVVKDFNQKAPYVKSAYVEWGHALVAEASIALGTNGIATCSVLKLIDQTSDDLHYMLHAYSTTEPSSITKSLKKARSLGMNLKDSEIEIMPGSSLDSESTPHILEAIYKITSSLIDKVVLIRDPKLEKKNDSQALTTYDGRTYRYTDVFPKNNGYYYSKLSSKGLEMVL